MAWIVRKDRVAVSPPLATENEADIWLHKYQGQSIERAMRNEGYNVETMADADEDTTVYTKTIRYVRAFRLGDYQVPRWHVTFTDGTMAATKVNVDIRLNQPEYRRGPVRFTVDRQWQIVQAVPAPETMP